MELIDPAKKKDELSIGKAGEHLACAYLIKQGFTCFLSDQGLAYDLLVEKESRIYKMQVKTTTKTVSVGNSKDLYRFGLRSGRGSTKRYNGIDYFAFVCLDIMKVAFLHNSELRNKNGDIVMLVEFRSSESGRGYSNGKKIEDYQLLKISEATT